jgi:hypothetical protein
MAEPLELADGTLVDVTTGRVINPSVEEVQAENYVSVPSNTQAQAIVAQTRRKVSDLPDIPERMNTISIVLTYYMFGMDNEEIAIASGLRVEQVVSVKLLDAFSKMLDAVSKGILKNDKGEVQSIIEDAGVEAVNMVKTIMTHGEDDKVRLTAAKDILDRGGHRPADILEIRGQMSSTLKIEHVIRSDDMVAPIIDSNVEYFEN